MLKLGRYLPPKKSSRVTLRASSETQGQSVVLGERVRRKFSSTDERAPGYRLSPNYFKKFKWMPAPDWAQKMFCIIVHNRREQFLLSSFREFVHDGYCFDHGLSGSCTKQRPKNCTQPGNYQFDIKSPSDFKILSARKLMTLFRKYKLELTTSIHACIGHVLRKC